MGKPLICSLLAVALTGCGGIVIGAIAPDVLGADGRYGPVIGGIYGGIALMVILGIPAAILGWVLGWAIDQSIKGEYSEERSDSSTHS